MMLPANRPSSVPSLGETLIDVIGGDHRAGALHVAHDDGRIAGDVLAEMARHQPRIGVGAAAGIEARDEIDRLAAVEIGDVVGAGRQRTGRDCAAQRCSKGI